MLKLKDAYRLWQSYLVHIPKQNRYTLGSRIDQIFLTTIEFCFLASYAPTSKKVAHLDQTISRLDLLKLLLQLIWEIGALDTNKYIELSEQLAEVGRMLGGWRKGLITKTSTSNGGGRNA